MTKVPLLTLGFITIALALCAPRPAEAASPAGGVVGTGNHASCTEVALEAKLAGGGLVTFNCGSPLLLVITSPKIISANTTLDGGDLISLSGANASAIFTVTLDAQLTLTHLTVTGAHAAKDGGAIFNSGRLLIDHAQLNGNVATGHKGGAIYNEGLVTISNSSFDANLGVDSGGQGGAIYSVGVMTITQSSFTRNQASLGGALVNDNGIATITGSTFAHNGNTGELGGAILTFGTLRTVDTDFDNNQGLSGGAINSEGNLSISGGVFYSNTAVASAGGAISGDGQTLITGTTFLSNTAGNGGGAILVGHFLTVTASTFQGNRANAAPGGAILNNGQLFLNAVSVFSNTSGGGLGNGISSAANAVLVVLNSTISANPDFLPLARPSGQRPAGSPTGGGLVAFGPVTVTNSTLTGNDEGGLVNYGVISITVKNSLIANNFGFNCFGPIHSLGHNLDSADSCHLRASGDLTTTNPLLGPLADNGGPTLTQALLPGSPAINHGDNAGCPAADQRGFLRVGGCDIGAFENAFRTLLPLLRR